MQEGFCANNGKSCNESIYYIADTINAGYCEAEENLRFTIFITVRARTVC